MFHFFWRDAMPSDMLDSLIEPDEFLKLHARILHDLQAQDENRVSGSKKSLIAA